MFNKKKDDFVINTPDSVFDQQEEKTDDVRNTTDISSTKLGLYRAVIKLKNHIAYVPLFLTCLAMVFLTCALHSHNLAISRLTEQFSSLLMFLNILAAILSCICYLNYQGKHISKGKKIMYFSLFAVLMIFQLFIDFHLLHEYSVEMNLITSSIYSWETNWQVFLSAKWLRIHIVFIFITLVTAGLEPFLQPMFESIHVRVK